MAYRFTGRCVNFHTFAQRTSAACTCPGVFDILMDYERERRKRGGRSAGHGSRSRRSVRSEKKTSKERSLH